MKQRLTVFIVMAVFLAGSMDSAQNPVSGEEPAVSTKGGFGGGLTVMTRNVYVGADVDLLIENGLEALDQVLGQLFTTSFPDRARGFAMEIAQSRPHLIGLQEISIIRGNIPDFGVFELNYLDILMMTLSAYGLNYKVAGMVENFDFMVPIIPGTDYYAQLIDYDVVLARADVEISDVSTGRYQAYLPIAELGLDIYRGYVAVTAKVKRKSYRFVSTHLEAVPEGHPEVEYIQLMQAQELLGILQSEILPTIVVGDLNTEAPDWQTYQLFVNSGYVDAWKRNLLFFNRKGYTYGHDPDLRNETVNFTKRIDFVMVRSNKSFGSWQVIGPVFAWVVGDQLKDRVWVEDFQEWIWPSDHGGVVAHLRIPTW